MNIKVIIHQEEDCVWAEVPAMPGCITYADTIDELSFHLKDAIEGWISVATDQYELKPQDKILELAL